MTAPDNTEPGAERGEKGTLRQRAWSVLTWRSVDGLRPIDTLMAWPLFGLGFLVRYVWESDWAMLSIPLAAAVVVQSNRHLWPSPSGKGAEDG